MLQLTQVEEWQKNLARHDVLAPLRSFAHHVVHADLLAILKLLLDRKSDFGLDAVNASLVTALVCKDYAALFLDVADRAESVGHCDQL